MDLKNNTERLYSSLNAHNFHHYEFLLVPSYKFISILTQAEVISI